MTMGNYSKSELYQLAVDVLEKHNTSLSNAQHVAKALVAAEADGLASHGLSRLPAYSAQADSGKVAGFAVPEVDKVASAALHIDAANGFAFPALALAVDSLAELVTDTGIAVAAITRSHHFGVAGYHVEELAQRGMIGLLFGNSPQAIAPWGGSQGLFGTNPIAFATPRKADAPLVIDLSLSKVARGKIMLANQRDEPIPEGWALDAEGKPTSDPAAAMAGTMLPMGDAKGAALVLMVEILAAALTSANFGFEASSFFDADGQSPGVGQLLIAINPGPLSHGGYSQRLDTLLGAILDQPGTRLPGQRRLTNRAVAETEGVQLPEKLYRTLSDLLL